MFLLHLSQVIRVELLLLLELVTELGQFLLQMIAGAEGLTDQQLLGGQWLLQMTAGAEGPTVETQQTIHSHLNSTPIPCKTVQSLVTIPPYLIISSNLCNITGINPTLITCPTNKCWKLLETAMRIGTWRPRHKSYLHCLLLQYPI